MIRKAVFLAVLFLAPGTAIAHPGHGHVVNDEVHHTLEGVVALLAVVALTAYAVFRLRSRRSDERSPRTPNS